VFTFRDDDAGVGVEVHHADANEVDVVIAKMRWAREALASRCPRVAIHAWIWVAAPPDGAVFFPRLHPWARRLAEAGILFPTRAARLP
jgi:hypothetical protein